MKLKSDHLRKHDFKRRFVVENCRLFSVKLLIQKCVTCEYPLLPLQFMKPGKAKASVTSIYQMAYQDLRRLEAVCSDFQRFCATCEHLERRWGANSAFGVGDLNFTSHFREIHVDKVSRCIIPPNVRCMIPVTATGDGNCLFNSASLAICQKETLALEF